MSLFFILNNAHFAIEVLGALVFLSVAWLDFDSLLLRRGAVAGSRFVGFLLLAFWQLIHAFTASGDSVTYIGFFLYIAGLALVLLSFVLERSVLRTKVAAILILPAIATVAVYVHSAAAIFYFLIFYLAFRQYKFEFKKTLKPFLLAFLFFSAGAALSAFAGEDVLGILWILAHVLELFGFIVLGFWVFQYLGLRVREELVLIFVSSALLISIVVTLAFSIILVGQIEGETRASLLTNVKVLDLYVGRLKEEAFAKTRLLGETTNLASLLAAHNFAELERVAGEMLQNEKLEFLTIVDEGGNVVLRATLPTQRGDSLSKDRAVSSALAGNAFSDIAFSPIEQFSVRASAPLVSKGKIVGALVAGFLLDNATADNLKKITGLEVSIIEKDTIVATTLFNPDGRTRSVGVKITDTEVLSSVLEKGEGLTLRTEILSRPALASYLPIKNNQGDIVGALSSVKPQREILDLVNAVNQLTLVTVAILMLIFAVPIYFITRRLSEPT